MTRRTQIDESTDDMFTAKELAAIGTLTATPAALADAMNREVKHGRRTLGSVSGSPLFSSQVSLFDGEEHGLFERENGERCEICGWPLADGCAH